MRFTLILLPLLIFCLNVSAETIAGIDLESLKRPSGITLNSQEIHKEQNAKRSIRAALRLIQAGQIEARTEDEFSKLLNETIDRSDVREAGLKKIKEGETRLIKAAGRLEEIYTTAKERTEFTSEARSKGMMYEWTSKDERTLNAGFISMSEDEITVISEAGNEYTIPLERLVDRDKLVAKIFSLGRGFNATGLLETIASGSTTELGYFIDAGFTPPQEIHGEAFLQSIESGQNSRMTQILIDWGLDVNSYSSDGSTPLSHAVQAGKLATVRTLLQAGADPLLRDSSDPKLSPIVWSLHKRDPVITTLLFRSSEDKLGKFLSSLSDFVSKEYFKTVSLETAKGIQEIINGRVLPYDDIQTLKLSLVGQERTITGLENVMIVKELRPLVVTFHNLEFYRYTIRRNQEFIRPLIELWKQQHASGELAASYSLALAYLDGWADLNDPDLIKEYLSTAIEGEHSPSMILMGEIYEEGLLGEVDEDQAYKLYLLAAEQNDPLGMVKVGHCYEDGLSVEVNRRKAVEWYERATKTGSAEGMAQLGRCYLNGIGVNENSRLGLEWYTKAAEANSSSAMFFLGKALLQGDKLRKNTNDGIEWLNRAAEFGERSALLILGNAYSDGTVREDYKLANTFFKEGAERGDAEAMYRYAENLSDGKGTRKDEKEAFKWYQRAADKEHLEATNQLALCYNSGRGVKKDQKKAFTLFKKASSLGHMQATANLAICYARGLGVPVDKDESARLYLQVINSNDSSAKQILKLLEEEN